MEMETQKVCERVRIDCLRIFRIVFPDYFYCGPLPFAFRLSFFFK